MALAGALALGLAAVPDEAAAGWRHGHGHGFGHGRFHGGFHGFHGPRFHGPRFYGGFYGPRFHGGYWRPRPVFVRPYPVYRPYPVFRPVVVVRPYPVYRPIYRPVYRPIYRPYPVAYRPVGYGFGPSCRVIRRVGFTPYGYRKVVTVKKCIVP